MSALDNSLGQYRVRMRCPNCKLEVQTVTIDESTIVTHTLAAILCIFFWPFCLCLVPYCICQEKVHYCPNCRIKIVPRANL